MDVKAKVKHTLIITKKPTKQKDTSSDYVNLNLCQNQSSTTLEIYEYNLQALKACVYE